MLNQGLLNDAAASYQISGFQQFVDRHDIELEGLLMVDVTEARGVHVDEDEETDRLNEVDGRRARLGINGDISRRLKAELSLDFDIEESTTSLHEVSLSYESTQNINLDAGLIKQPFGLEGSTSSKRLRPLERSIASDAFVPDRAWGLLLSQHFDKAFIGFGAFVDQDNNDDAIDFTARAVWSPIKNDQAVLHFGVNGSYRDPRGDDFRLRSNGSVFTGDNFVRSDRFFPQSVTTTGLEGALAIGSLLIQAEWFYQSLELDDADAVQPEFSGAYVQVGWIFGQGRRKYDGRRFGKTAKGNRPGNLELIGGFSTADLRYLSSADQADEYTLGVNYEIAKNLGVSAQVQYVELLSNNEIVEEGEAAQLRFVATW